MTNIQELIQKIGCYKFGLNQSSLLLSSIVGEFLIEDSSLINKVSKELSEVDSKLGKTFPESAIWVLWDDHAKRSPLSSFEGYFSPGIQIDIELPRNFENTIEELEDEDIDRVNNILKKLKEELVEKTKELMDSFGVSEEDLDRIK